MLLFLCFAESLILPIEPLQDIKMSKVSKDPDLDLDSGLGQVSAPGQVLVRGLESESELVLESESECCSPGSDLSESYLHPGYRLYSRRLPHHPSELSYLHGPDRTLSEPYPSQNIP